MLLHVGDIYDFFSGYVWMGFAVFCNIVGFTFAFWVEIVVKYHSYIGVLPGKGPGC